MNYSKIDQLRISNNYTVDKVCKGIGITPAGWYRILEKHSTTVDTLEKLAEFFKKPISYFFDEESKAYVNKIEENIAAETTYKICPICREKAQTIANLNKYIELIETKNPKRKKPAV